MTIGSLVLRAAAELKQAGCPDPRYDARCLMEHCLATDPKGILLRWEDPAQPEIVSSYAKLVEMRSSRRPLQYIIGNWEFMGLEFFVGEGALIPRQDSELLAHRAISLILESRENKVVYDLCAGTGCIGISIAHYASKASVWLIEKSGAAFSYLAKNDCAHNLPNTALIQGDIELGAEHFCLPDADILVCNPPYIRTEELDGLQPEVRKEPPLALDGGEDGLSCYRILERKWLNKMRPGSRAILEIADDMTAGARSIFSKAGWKTEVLQDIAGKDRALFITIE